MLKQELISRGEASELFAQEKRTGNLEGIVWNIFQSAFGADSYPTIQSKSAHLLYFIVKNHPFTDGNKRSGAFAFVWLLQKSGIDFRHTITPEALTAITLLIATSDPKDKQRVIDLIILLLSSNT
jgi:death-on-curing family protein